jgi:DNA-binding NtrC family response regulator
MESNPSVEQGLKLCSSGIRAEILLAGREYMSFIISRARILIVDDDTTILRSITQILEAEGYTVDTAGSGCEAIEKSKKECYDLALIDIRLPDIKGTRLLRDMEMGTPRMKTIMITGYATLENAIESLNLGADGYLEKPVNPKRLLSIIREKLKECPSST